MAKLILLTGLLLLLNVQIDCAPSRRLSGKLTSATRPPTTTTAPPTTTISSTFPLCDTHGPTTEITTLLTTRADFCAGKANGVYADPTNKRNFFKCSDGESHLQSCKEGQVFDTSCSCCKSP